ncbi:uncharacterized protein LOC134230715 [Saccostrea cucullata]|uniref:uncharacterized protein LOC134230715 n=1 Tax=Saccostrea cuccullata TaxID=36930 RepID=UPI002ECFEAA0
MGICSVEESVFVICYLHSHCAVFELHNFISIGFNILFILIMVAMRFAWRFVLAVKFGDVGLPKDFSPSHKVCPINSTVTDLCQLLKKTTEYEEGRLYIGSIYFITGKREAVHKC